MTSAIGRVAGRAATMLRDRRQGTVTLTRVVPATPDPATPWAPGAAESTDVYQFDAYVTGVVADQIDGTTILATDLVVIVPPSGRHTLSDGEAADGAITAIVPTVADTLTIDGAAKTIKRVRAYPAAGVAALFHIFVAS